MSLPLQLKRARKLFRAIFVARQARALLGFGVLAGNEHFTVLNKKLLTVIDIGANRGQFALAARARLPNSRIDSFEPLAGPARVYRDVFAGDSLTKLHTIAIGARAERRQMHLAVNDDSSSLLPASGIQRSYYPGTEVIGIEEVQVMPLDQVIAPGTLRRPSLLKIDVQGAEFDTLVGCERLLAEIDQIYCECSFVELYSGQRLASEIIAWLFERGFDLAGVYNMDRDSEGHALQADLLFRARSSENSTT